MAQTQDELERDWLHAVFSVLRDEAVAISADFGQRVKHEVDQLAATRDIHPPSAVALLGAVALETTNIIASQKRCERCNARAADTKNSKCDQDAIKFIWGCDNRTSGPTSLETIKSTPPWQHIGQTSTGGTGCLIASTFVLTAAHAIVGGDGLPYSDKMVFSAGFSNGKCALGSRWVNRAWIPTQYKKGSSKEVKCYDWGIVRIDSEIATPSMAFDAIPVADIKAKPIFSVGYPGSLTQIMWSTGANQKVIDDFEDPQGPGGLLRTTLDGEGGQSGSPVYIFQGNTRVIVGVLVGAPNCAEGANWVALINDDVRGKIKAVIDTGTTPEGLKHFVFKTDVLPPGCGTTDVLETGF